jgi:hypothetical protein
LIVASRLALIAGPKIAGKCKQAGVAKHAPTKKSSIGFSLTLSSSPVHLAARGREEEGAAGTFLWPGFVAGVLA